MLKDQEEAALWCSNCRIIDQNGSIVDEKMNEKVLDIFMQLKNKNVITVIVTHDNAIAERFDRVIRIVDGGIEI